MIDDCLGVANVGCRRMLEESALEHQHHLGSVSVADRVNPGVVVAGQHEHFVGAAGLCLDVNGTAVMHRKRLVADEVTGAPDRVTKSFRCLLTGKAD